MDLSEFNCKIDISKKTNQPDSIDNDNLHILSDKWRLWAHLPHDTDWSLKSYKKIIDIDSVEAALTLFNIFPDAIIKNCMLFIMRDGISPTWEDERNKDGGCFSYKINNKSVVSVWKNLSYTLVGETLSSNKNLQKEINGITISPKKNFCIIKIWLASCEFKNPKQISSIDTLASSNCLFKKHIDK